MIKSLFQHSLRSFRRQRAGIVINVIGLSIGMSCSLFIALYIINETGYDRFNSKKDRIFRLITRAPDDGSPTTGSWSAPVMGPVLSREIPEIEDYLRMANLGFHPVDIRYKNQLLTGENIIQADSSFFNFFSIPVLEGDPPLLLNAPRKAVVSQSVAKKIFGSEDPLNKVFQIGEDSVLYTVSGVMADIPGNSHFSAGIIISFMNRPGIADPMWWNNSVCTYLLLKPNSSPALTEKKVMDLIMLHLGEDAQKFYGFSQEEFRKRWEGNGYFLQNLKEIHLDPSVRQEFKKAGDPKLLRILSSLALLIILIASINFMNLSTAQASRRTREAGMKKICGSSQSLLILQFLSESFMLSLIAVIMALLFIKAALPVLNNILRTRLELNLFSDWHILLLLAAFSLVTGFLAGGYPAFFISSFNPGRIVAGDTATRGKRTLRSVLVIFQFAVCFLLIVGTVVMHRQIRYMLDKDPGFRRERLLVISNADILGARYKPFREALKGIPGIDGVVSSSSVPGRNNNHNRYRLEGRGDDKFLMWTNYVDCDFISTYGMKLLSGRTFRDSFTGDGQACLLNESAIKEYGITDPEATRIISGRDTGNLKYLKIIGIVKDFNTESLHNQIQPYIFRLQNDYLEFLYLTVKISSADYSGTIAGMEKVWKEFTSGKPLKYYFLEDDMGQMYLGETQDASIAMLFSVISVLIAILGLFGLTSFTVAQRTREIGIRKAMGASVTGIFLRISGETVILITLASLIAFPVIYYLAVKWLESFYYRITMGASIFITGFAVVLGIALLSVSYRIVVAARVNPAQSLKYE
jgi:putative ABC transport system permease protein